MSATSSILETPAPDFLTVGHATRDVLPNGNWQLGGSVTFAALTAARLGLRAAVVTSGPEDVVAALHETLVGIPIHAISSPEATIYENIYTNGLRRQYLRGRARQLTLDAIPLHWRTAPVILLAPLANEVDPEIAAALSTPHGAFVAATPQGWLRRFGARGAVSSGPFVAADRILPYLKAVILSYEDLGLSSGPTTPDQHALSGDTHTKTRGIDRVTTLLSTWARMVPLIALTRGSAGALLCQQGQPPENFPGYPAHEVDPTGAGDVFAAAFLVQMYRGSDARVAMDFANRVAACSVESTGVSGIPTYEMVSRRFGRPLQ